MTAVAAPIEPEDRVLDWERRFSPKSLPFKIAAQAHRFSKAKPRNRQWTRTAVLDQGRQGACTGFTLAHNLLSKPRLVPDVGPDRAREFYYEARRRDQWAGEDYEGSSILGVMEAGRNFGVVKDYWWATTLEEIITGVALYGPMAIGVDWYEGMWRPNADGFLTPTGRVIGGHALQLGGVSVTGKWFRADNSWGPGWGEKGTAKVSFETVEVWLRGWGEFALARKPQRYALAV